MSSSSSSRTIPEVVTIGPLTTIFTPPPPCATPLLRPDDPGTSDTNTILLYANNCTSTGTSNDRGVASLCFPSGYFTEEDGGFFDTRYSKFQAFSPASLCPEGYTSVCGASHDPRPGFEGATELLPLIKTDEAVQICCPSGGWGCQLDNLASINCEMTFFSDPVKATLCADQGSSGAFTSVSGSTVFGIASPIALIHPIDLNAIQTASPIPSAAPSSVAGAPLPPATSTSELDGGAGRSGTESHSLSGGAKAGIGVGVSIGALLIIALIAFLWYLQHSAKHRRQRITDFPTHRPELKHEMPDNQTRTSRAAVAYPHELEISKVKFNAPARVESHELDDNNTMVSPVEDFSHTELESPRGVELHNTSLPMELDSKRLSAQR